MKEMLRTCILCPKGCELVIRYDDHLLNKVVAFEDMNDQFIVIGNNCNKGIQFAYDEFYHPKRTVQSTVKTLIKGFERLPVKTDGEIDKSLMMDVMDDIHNVVLKKQVKNGEIIIENIHDTGVNIVATSDMTLYF